MGNSHTLSKIPLPREGSQENTDVNHHYSDHIRKRIGANRHPMSTTRWSNLRVKSQDFFCPLTKWTFPFSYCTSYLSHPQVHASWPRGVTVTITDRQTSRRRHSTVYINSWILPLLCEYLTRNTKINLRVGSSYEVNLLGFSALETIQYTLWHLL